MTKEMHNTAALSLIGGKHRFDLIDSNFLPEKAMEILITLVDNKINYHNREIFSQQERFGAEAIHSKMRVRDLQQVKLALKELIAMAEEENMKLSVRSTIEITLVDK